MGLDVVKDSTVRQQLIAGLPESMACAIVVFQQPDGMACQWYGLSPQQVVKTLHDMADLVLTRRCIPAGLSTTPQ